MPIIKYAIIKDAAGKTKLAIDAGSFSAFMSEDEGRQIIFNDVFENLLDTTNTANDKNVINIKDGVTHRQLEYALSDVERTMNYNLRVNIAFSQTRARDLIERPLKALGIEEDFGAIKNAIEENDAEKLKSAVTKYFDQGNPDFDAALQTAIKQDLFIGLIEDIADKNFTKLSELLEIQAVKDAIIASGKADALVHAAFARQNIKVANQLLELPGVFDATMAVMFNSNRKAEMINRSLTYYLSEENPNKSVAFGIVLLRGLNKTYDGKPETIENINKLMAIPGVREDAIANDFYHGLDTQGKLKEIAANSENAMRALSPAEQQIYTNVKRKFAAESGDFDKDKAKCQATVDEFKEYLRAQYAENPAKLTIGDQEIKLPFEWEALQALRTEGGPLQDKAQYDLALVEYYKNDFHSTYRYLLKPNPWIHPDAHYVNYIDPDDRSQGAYSAFESYVPTIAYFWLAAKDPSEEPKEGFGTIEDRMRNFATSLALLGRAHNWDNTRKNPITGKDEYYEDLGADRPSCHQGVNQRLFQSVLGHSLFEGGLTEENIKMEIKDFVRNYYAKEFGKIPADDLVTARDLLEEKYFQEQPAVIPAVIKEEQLQEFINELFKRYKDDNLQILYFENVIKPQVMQQFFSPQDVGRYGGSHFLKYAGDVYDLLEKDVESIVKIKTAIAAGDAAALKALLKGLNGNGNSMPPENVVQIIKDNFTQAIADNKMQLAWVIINNTERFFKIDQKRAFIEAYLKAPQTDEIFKLDEAGAFEVFWFVSSHTGYFPHGSRYVDKLFSLPIATEVIVHNANKLFELASRSMERDHGFIRKMLLIPGVFAKLSNEMLGPEESVALTKFINQYMTGFSGDSNKGSLELNFAMFKYLTTGRFALREENDARIYKLLGSKELFETIASIPDARPGWLTLEKYIHQYLDLPEKEYGKSPAFVVNAFDHIYNLVSTESANNVGWSLIYDLLKVPAVQEHIDKNNIVFPKEVIDRFKELHKERYPRGFIYNIFNALRKVFVSIARILGFKVETNKSINRRLKERIKNLKVRTESDQSVSAQSQDTQITPGLEAKKLKSMAASSIPKRIRKSMFPNNQDAEKDKENNHTNRL